MALQTAESIYHSLMRNKQDIVITKEQAMEIWLIFRKRGVSMRTFEDIRYRAFMQACLMSAIEGSEAMGWIDSLFRSAMKPTATVKGIIIALVKHGMQKYYKEKTGAPSELYSTIVTGIAYGHKPYLDDIQQGLRVMF